MMRIPCQTGMDTATEPTNLFDILYISILLVIILRMFRLTTELLSYQTTRLVRQHIKRFPQMTFLTTVLLIQYGFMLQPLFGNATVSNKMFDINTAASFNIKKGVEPNIFYFDILGQYSCRFAEAAVGMQVTSANTDVLFKAMYTPLNNPRHKIGLGMTYHFSYLYHVGSIHDFLPSFEYTLTILNTFIFFAQIGYLHQWIHIPVPHSRSIVIGQSSITHAMHFTGIIKKEWYLGGGISSYERFRYPVFANPSLSVDLYYRSTGGHLPRGFYLGIEGILRYSDLFTFSGYPENVVIKSVIGMEL